MVMIPMITIPSVATVPVRGSETHRAGNEQTVSSKSDTPFTKDLNDWLMSAWREISPRLRATHLEYLRTSDIHDPLNQRRCVFVAGDGFEFSIYMAGEDLTIHHVREAMREFVKSEEYRAVVDKHLEH